MAISKATAATPRVKSIQRTALAMLVAAGVINYVDRATLAVANLLIRDDLHLSIADMGYLLSAFLWAYAFAQLPTGAMVDKLGPRLLLTFGLSLWSFAQLLGGLIQSFGQFFGARVLLGVGEAPQFPTGARVVRDWFSPRGDGMGMRNQRLNQSLCPHALPTYWVGRDEKNTPARPTEGDTARVMFWRGMVDG
jgi:MFS family permease